MSQNTIEQEAWPDIPFAAWQPTAAALHLYLQIVGKYRLARSPWVNHSWHATFYLTPRGVTTGLVPDGEGGVEVLFDFIDHALVGQCGSGRETRFSLKSMSVAEFHRAFIEPLVHAPCSHKCIRVCFAYTHSFARAGCMHSFVQFMHWGRATQARRSPSLSRF